MSHKKPITNEHDAEICCLEVVNDSKFYRWVEPNLNVYNEFGTNRHLDELTTILKRGIERHSDNWYFKDPLYRDVTICNVLDHYGIENTKIHRKVERYLENEKVLNQPEEVVSEHTKNRFTSITPTSKELVDDFVAHMETNIEQTEQEVLNHFINYKPKTGKIVMSKSNGINPIDIKVETRDFINGNDVEDMPMDTLIQTIAGIEAQIRNYEHIKVKSKAVNKEIKKLKRALDRVVQLADKRA